MNCHFLLIVLALIFCVLAMCGKVPIWISVLLLILDQLIMAVGRN